MGDLERERGGGCRMGVDFLAMGSLRGICFNFSLHRLLCVHTLTGSRERYVLSREGCILIKLL